MSSINRYCTLLLALLCVAGIFSLSGCGDRNSEAPDYNYENPDAGHPDQWLPSKHADEAEENIESCAECHGDSFDGGISDVSCTECHLGTKSEVHPLDWVDQDALRHNKYVESFGDEACAAVYCHGAKLDGVEDSGPSCLTACHMGSADFVHAPDWGEFTYALHDSYVKKNGTLQCSNVTCHGPNLSGVAGSGPHCSSCHLGDTVVDSAIIFSVHPDGWDVDITLHGDYVILFGSSSCAEITCHGGLFQGVPGSGPSCFACH